VVRLSLTFGNVIIGEEDGRPWLIDMEGSERLPRTSGVSFNYLRDRDREKFNKIYGRSVITESRARQILDEHFSNAYAPVDFGQGLATHGFWTTESGTGRWEYLNGKVVTPLVRGKRVLDLGANNGIMDMVMLRNGARQVVALEFSAEFVAMARQVQTIFEWRDMRKYPFTIHNCDMREMTKTSFGDFDVVTAFCSLYYLEPEDMIAVVRKAANIAPLLIVQAKLYARPEVEGKGKKSSLEYLASLLRENGYPRLEIHSPRGFSRPIIVGYVNP
jgi:SAM-dependent methyltransferase